ncbi:CxC2 domain-containing protein [Mycena indigotica]|uniref:CxC2 domain-containing protein n=1 Tax=Mycena indigotica TaxID=2126181 RepID=A0A8H6VYI7_9AGAR|nr:CxC2 domain-containing protein [Mycena indigotica]KAF7298517.1 CxC2 domain-containing protein [Mycena indigotica]
MTTRAHVPESFVTTCLSLHMDNFTPAPNSCQRPLRPRKQSAIHKPAPLLSPDGISDNARILAALEAGEDPFACGFDFDEGHPQEKRAPRASDRPLQLWFDNDVQDYLDEFIRLEGDASSISECVVCGQDEAMLRCRDCLLDGRFCKSCIVEYHADLPFHRPERWQGSFFELCTLKSLGLRLQLGHPHGEQCPGTLARLSLASDGQQTYETFCVVECNGVHEIAINFCTCPSAPKRAIQLLRRRLFPATSTRPLTAATFSALRLFHILSFEAKCSAYEFYNTLARLTNNNGIFQPRDRYREFVTMSREWRFVQMLKRAGRGHEDNATRNVPAGSCALLCPACPQPGKNLPEDNSWQSVPRHQRFKYSLFLAIDANFKMKRKQVSTESVDPGLNAGSAFFSDVPTYMEHVRAHWSLEQEKSTCVSHDAVNEPDRESRGGQPHLGLAPSTKGERYINMDYMLWKSLSLPSYSNLVDIIVSYDILSHSASSSLRLPHSKIPPPRAHIERCNIEYSFDLTPYMGRTDGEAPERGWANANPLASSTREMGPGARRDTIDDHFNDWNHKKIVGLGKALLEKIKTAVAEMVETRAELLEVESALPREVIQRWTEVMAKWEDDSREMNPFNVTSKVESLQEIRARLKNPLPTTLDTIPPSFDTSRDIHGDLHAADMIAMALDSAISEREAKLQRKIISWFDIQRDFAPEVTALRATDEAIQANSGGVDSIPGAPLYRLQLLLPSTLIARSTTLHHPSHAWYEFQLRKGRCLHLLEELRRLLLVRTQKYKAKDKHTSGVAGHTRAAKAIQAVDERIRRVADDYRQTRAALLSLHVIVGDSSWRSVLKELKAADVRAMPRALFSDPDRDRRKRRRDDDDTPKEMSWIWRMGVGSLPADVAIDSLSTRAAYSEEAALAATNESLRVEWAKTRARAKRWAEEVELLEEEMRRVLQFCAWKANWWRERRDRRQGLPDAIMSGLRAYAYRQAHIQESRHAQFFRNWQDVPSFIQLGLDQLQAMHTDALDEGGAYEKSISLVADDDAAFMAVPESPEHIPSTD